MSVVQTWISGTYKPGDVMKRYVRCTGADITGFCFAWCEVGSNPAWDLRQGTCDESDLPVAIQMEARARYGIIPSYVLWPFPDPRP